MLAHYALWAFAWTTAPTPGHTTTNEPHTTDWTTNTNNMHTLQLIEEHAGMHALQKKNHSMAAKQNKCSMKESSFTQWTLVCPMRRTYTEISRSHVHFTRVYTSHAYILATELTIALLLPPRLTICHYAIFKGLTLCCMCCHRKKKLAWEESGYASVCYSMRCKQPLSNNLFYVFYKLFRTWASLRQLVIFYVCVQFTQKQPRINCVQSVSHFVIAKGISFFSECIPCKSPLS